MLRDVETVESAEGLTLNQLSEIVLKNSFYKDTSFKRFELTDDEGNQTEVYVNNRTYADHYIWKFGKYGPYSKCETLKDTQIADDFSQIPMTSCRCCKKENVQPYSENFFEKYFDHMTLFNYNNGYCRECAIKSAVKHPDPQIIKETHIREAKYDVGGESFTFRTEPDGSVYYWKNTKAKSLPMIQ